MREVEFDGERSRLRGWLYGHADPRPTVVMAHGFSASAVGMVADRYAEVLHEAGLAVLLYDHEGFGTSGDDRVINRWVQCRGYQHALGFAASQPEVDPARMALWGDSSSGSVVLTVAAYDERVAALVLQVPACGSSLGTADPEAYGYFGELLAHGDVIGGARLGEPLPVVSSDQAVQPSQLVPLTAYRWFMEYGNRPGSTWRNVATRAELPTRVPYTTDIVVGHLRCPSWWAIAIDDEMPASRTDIALACFELAGGAKERLMIDGGHFGLLYDNSEIFEQVSRAQAEFLVRVLGA